MAAMENTQKKTDSQPERTIRIADLGLRICADQNCAVLTQTGQCLLLPTALCLRLCAFCLLPTAFCLLRILNRLSSLLEHFPVPDKAGTRICRQLKILSQLQTGS